MSPAAGYSLCIVACVAANEAFRVSVALPCGENCMEGAPRFSVMSKSPCAIYAHLFLHRHHQRTHYSTHNQPPTHLTAVFDQVGLQEAVAEQTTTVVQLAKDIAIANDSPIAKSGGAPITIMSKDSAQRSLSGGWSGGDATDGFQILSLDGGAQATVDGVDIKSGRATNGGCVTATGASTTIELKNANFEYCKVS